MRIVDLLGKKFSKLKVIEKTEKRDSSGAIIWLCECECGKTSLVSSRSLKEGNTKSCGCLKVDAAIRIAEKYKRSTKPIGTAAQNRLYYTYKTSANKRNHVFEITKQEFLFLTKQNCFYCGIAPNQVTKIHNSNGQYIYNGIDRKDNTKGYTLENCVPCCKICNYMKGSLSYDDFISQCRRVIDELDNKA